MAVPALLYGCETWTIRKKDWCQLQAAEMSCLRSVKGYTRLDHIRNEYIRRELDIVSLNDLIQNYRNCWKQNLQRIKNTRFPKLGYENESVGRRSEGRPVTRWRESWGPNRRNPMHEVMMMMMIQTNSKAFLSSTTTIKNGFLYTLQCS